LERGPIAVETGGSLQVRNAEVVPGVRGATYDVQLAAGYLVTNGIDVVFGARLLEE